VVFIEESTSFLDSYEFAKFIKNTDNYYVIVSRDPLPQIPYAVSSINQIIKKGKNPKIDNIYKKISVNKVSGFPYEVVVVEDSKAGYQFFYDVTKDLPIECVSANGKSKILTTLKKYKGKRVLVIADAAALGPEIREIESYRKLVSDKIDLFLPESFEWLILNSEIFLGDGKVKPILDEPASYIESSQYFSWEKFFEYLLVDVTKESKDIKYRKDKLAKGYLLDKRKEMILKSME